MPVAPPKPKYEPSIDKDVLNDLTLAWWRLRMNSDDPKTVERCYAIRGYLGCTVTNMGDHEWETIKAWVKERRRNDVYLTKRDWDCGDEPHVRCFIGGYKDYCIGVWCRTPKLLDEFYVLLEAFPKRTKALVVKNPKAAMQFIKGTNYKVLKGDDKCAIGVGEDMDPTDMMLLILAAT